jgi:transposase
MLTKETNYFWARPSLVAHKMRGMELQAGRPQKKGSTRGPAYAYNVKELRNQEMRVAEQAQKGYEHFVEAWRPRPPKKARGRLNPARLE